MSDTYRRSPYHQKDPKAEINEMLLQIEMQESLEEFYVEEEENDSLEEYLKKNSSEKSNSSRF
jgi:hypothetical protein